MKQSLVRISAFLRKEIVDILRQPRLMVSLVAGPFLILLLFGIGYRTTQQPLTTLFVVTPGSEVERRIQEFAPQFSNAFVFVGTTGDRADALARLRRREIDLVVIAPASIYEIIRENRPAFFNVYHNEIDPLRIGYIGFIGQLYIDEINRTILKIATGEGQADVGDLERVLRAAQTAVDDVRAAIARGDVDQARDQAKRLSEPVNQTYDTLDPMLRILDNLSAQLEGDTGSKDREDIRELRQVLDELRSDLRTIEDMQSGQSDREKEMLAIDRIGRRLDDLVARLSQFRSLDPNVIVRPLLTRSESVAATEPTVTAFYAPAVIVLLLQHLMVTFAALTLVREQQSGSIELFRASPLTAFEALTGKYLSYLLFGGALGAVLTGLLVFGLRVPMLGRWPHFVVTLLAMLFASLGVGFIISLVSQTDSQAVQLSMLVLLGSVFFAGAFLSLQTLWEPMRVVSWLLPATYAIQLLQTIMLRGFGAEPQLLAGLAGMGAALFAISFALLHHKMRTE